MPINVLVTYTTVMTSYYTMVCGNLACVLAAIMARAYARVGDTAHVSIKMREPRARAMKASASHNPALSNCS